MTSILPALGQVTGYKPTSLGPLRIPGGPVQGFVGSTLLGAGVGGLGGWILNQFARRPDRGRARRWALLGALAAGIPAGIGSFGLAKDNYGKIGVPGLFDTAAAKAAASVPFGVGVEGVIADPAMTPWQKALSLEVLREANRSGGSLLTVEDLVKGAVGAGLGYAAGHLMAKTLVSMFGIPDGAVPWLRRAGAGVGGASGIGWLK